VLELPLRGVFKTLMECLLRGVAHFLCNNVFRFRFALFFIPFAWDFLFLVWGSPPLLAPK
jgi:hypothetical protein